MVDYAEDGVTQIGETKLVIHTHEHQGHYLANQTLEQAGKALAESRPFFIHATPLMVGYH